MSKLLFTPGPGNVPREIRSVLEEDVIHHRTTAYHTLTDIVTDKLKKVFKTTEDVLILTASGTGAMESTVVNLFSSGDEVLVINTGSFGQRFVELCNVYSLVTHELTYDWGRSYEIDDVVQYLADYPNIKGIFVTHHETSTGVCNDLQALGALTKNTERLLIADCISGMIAHPFDFEAFGVDCAVAASQKGFNLPPGLAFVALSEKAKKVLDTSNLPKYYFDYRKYINALHQKSEQPFTPAVTIVNALNLALDQLFDAGLENIVLEKTALRKYTEQKFESLGFELFVKQEADRGNVLVAVLAPKSINLFTLCEQLDSAYNLTVAKGLGSYNNNMLRIGLLGDINTHDINTLAHAIQALSQ